MAHGYDFSAEELGQRLGLQAGVPVIHVVKAVNGIGLLLLLIAVPRLAQLVGVHAVGKGERRRNIDILEQIERSAYRNRMLHAVTPVLDQVTVKELTLLRRNAVAQLSGIGKRNFLIPAFVSHLFFTLKGVHTRQVDAQIRQSNRYRRVAHALRQVGRSGNTQSDA